MAPHDRTRGNGIAALTMCGVLVVGWIGQYAAYAFVFPKLVRWMDVKDPRTMLIAYAPLGVVTLLLIAVALFFSISRRQDWWWGRHVLLWITAAVLFALFAVTSILVQLSLTGLSPAH